MIKIAKVVDDKRDKARILLLGLASGLVFGFIFWGL